MFDGILGNMFDLNNDGNVDVFEQGLEFIVLQHLMEQGLETEEREKLTDFIPRWTLLA